MNNIEKKLREEISADIHNKEFIVKFNLAIHELVGDKTALITFVNAVLPMLKLFAKSNDKTLDQMLMDLKKYHKKADLPDVEGLVL